MHSSLSRGERQGSLCNQATENSPTDRLQTQEANTRVSCHKITSDPERHKTIKSLKRCHDSGSRGVSRNCSFVFSLKICSGSPVVITPHFHC